MKKHISISSPISIAMTPSWNMTRVRSFPTPFISFHTNPPLLPSSSPLPYSAQDPLPYPILYQLFPLPYSGPPPFSITFHTLWPLSKPLSSPLRLFLCLFCPFHSSSAPHPPSRLSLKVCGGCFGVWVRENKSLFRLNWITLSWGCDNTFYWTIPKDWKALQGRSSIILYLYD